MTFWPDRTELDACIAELLDTDHLLDRVRALLPQQVATGLGDPGTAHTKKTRPGEQPSAPIPWNDHAADFVITVHAGARDLERNLTLLVHRSARFRGGSDQNTTLALKGLPDLVMLAAERHGRECAEAVTTWEAVTRWPRQARAILDEARTSELAWTKAPGGLMCPHCRRRLQLKPGWEQGVDWHRPERAPSLWCRACPVAVEGDEGPRPTREYGANGWLGMLQEGA